jgi:hypothetical protein
VRPDGGGGREVSVTVPREAFDLFLEVLGHMANGNAVTIVPVHAELTTRDVSAPTRGERGFYIIRRDQRRPGFSRSLAEVEDQIRRQLLSGVRTGRVAELVVRARREHKVEGLRDQPEPPVEPS